MGMSALLFVFLYGDIESSQLIVIAVFLSSSNAIYIMIDTISQLTVGVCGFNVPGNTYERIIVYLSNSYHYPCLR